MGVRNLTNFLIVSAENFLNEKINGVNKKLRELIDLVNSAISWYNKMDPGLPNICGPIIPPIQLGI